VLGVIWDSDDLFMDPALELPLFEGVADGFEFGIGAGAGGFALLSLPLGPALPAGIGMGSEPLPPPAAAGGLGLGGLTLLSPPLGPILLLPE